MDESNIEQEPGRFIHQPYYPDPPRVFDRNYSALPQRWSEACHSSLAKAASALNLLPRHPLRDEDFRFEEHFLLNPHADGGHAWHADGGLA